MTDVQRILQVLTDAGVDFVVIGGVAMVLRGSGRVAAIERGSSLLEVGRLPVKVMDLDALARSKP